MASAKASCSPKSSLKRTLSTNSPKGDKKVCKGRSDRDKRSPSKETPTTATCSKKSEAFNDAFKQETPSESTRCVHNDEAIKNKDDHSNNSNKDDALASNSCGIENKTPGGGWNEENDQMINHLHNADLNNISNHNTFPPSILQHTSDSEGRYEGVSTSTETQGTTAKPLNSPLNLSRTCHTDPLSSFSSEECGSNLLESEEESGDEQQDLCENSRRSHSNSTQMSDNQSEYESHANVSSTNHTQDRSQPPTDTLTGLNYQAVNNSPVRSEAYKKLITNAASFQLFKSEPDNNNNNNGNNDDYSTTTTAPSSNDQLAVISTADQPATSTTKNSSTGHSDPASVSREELRDGLMVLYLKDQLFVEATIKNISPPDM